MSIRMAVVAKDCPVRYVVVSRPHVWAHPRQGRYTYATPEEAQAWIDGALTPGTNSVDTLKSIFGEDFEFSVEAWYCYPGHFDPIMPVIGL